MRLTIHLDPSTGIRVEGPLDNKPLIYFMLEEAKDAVKAHYARQASLIQPVAAVPHLLPPNGSK